MVVGAVLVVVGCGVVLFISNSSRSFEPDFHREMTVAEHPEMYEDASSKVRRYESEAEANMLKECSNYAGFSRVLDHYISASDKPMSDWVGHATIDFVNKAGGVERTNLQFRYIEINNTCMAIMDEGALLDRQQKQ